VAGPARWLLARRAVGDPEGLAYCVSNAPVGTPPETLARVAARRWPIEQCFEEAKGEAGLDHYEVRQWSSWYRHVTLALLAHSFLADLRRRGAGGNGDLAEELIGLTVPEVRRLLEVALPLPPRSRAARLAWSRWRRRHQACAKRCHYQRRLTPSPPDVRL